VGGRGVANALGIGEYVGVPEADYTPVLDGEPGVADFVIGVLGMLPAVGLDDQPCGRAGEVRDVGPDRELAAELVPFAPLGAEQLP